MISLDDVDRRSYWTEQMENAFVFMEGMRTFSLSECEETLSSMEDSVVDLDVVFSDTKINNQFPRVYYIRTGLIDSFKSLAKEMNELGWVLKVEDGYRSPTMQRAQSHNPKHFDSILEMVRWELGGQTPDAALLYRRLSVLIATRCRVGTHISGSAIDISVLDRATGCEIDRGGSYVEFSERTPMASPFITDLQAQNRHEICALMQKHGWIAYPWEFWHFSSGDSYAEALTSSAQPARYGPVSFENGTIQPIQHPDNDALLEPLAFYETQIKEALARASS